jgi:hypothetical protein
MFSCFARPDSFYGGTEGVEFCFLFYAPGLIFGGNEGVLTRFHVLRYRTRFHVLRYRGR